MKTPIFVESIGHYPPLIPTLATLGIAVLLLAGKALAGPDSKTEPNFAGAARQAASLTLMPGLNLDIWAVDPQFENPVAFSFDNFGRCYIAETHRFNQAVMDITKFSRWLTQDLQFRRTTDRQTFLEGAFATEPALLTNRSEIVRMLEDQKGRGRADHSEIFANGFNTPLDGIAAGVLAEGTNVWFANIPNLWKLGTVPGARTRVAVATGFGVHIGVTGHDLHGLILGPDGRLYFSSGDRGFCVTNQQGRVLNHPDTGGVLRCDLDGSHLEVFCTGLRNPQELAFDDLGNLWTVDNDTAGADPCRVLHLIHRGDYGWRTSYQHMEGFGPWVQEELWKGGRDGILPPAGTVSQGPSGLAYYPGTGFGNRFAGRFLHCDFPGGVWSFSVKPEGGSYVVADKEKVLWGAWPTDVDFGPDGALYILDWVAGWEMPQRGRIYRLTEASGEDDTLRREVWQLLKSGMSEQTDAGLLTLLPHRDRRVRQAAQFELVRRGANSFRGLRDTALVSRSRFARLHALWAIEQLCRTSSHTDPMEWANRLIELRPLIHDSDDEVRGQTAKVLAESNLQNFRPLLTELLADTSARVRFLAAAGAAGAASGHQPVLWHPNHPMRTTRSGLDATVDPLPIGTGTSGLATSSIPAIPITAFANALRKSDRNDPFFEQAIICLLAPDNVSAVADSLAWCDRFAQDESPRVRRVGLLALRRLEARQLTNFLSDPEPELVLEAGRAIHDVPIPGAMGALANLVLRIDCPEGLLSRALDACYRVGSDKHAKMLTLFAQRTDAPEKQRALAIELLGHWRLPKSETPDRLPGESRDPRAYPGQLEANPETFDRVIGLFRPVAADSSDGDRTRRSTRNEQPARRALLAAGGTLMESTSESIQLAVIESTCRLRAKEASTGLFNRLSSTNTPASVQAAIIEALAYLNASQAPAGVRFALGQTNPIVRSAALPHLHQLEGEEAGAILAALTAREIRCSKEKQSIGLDLSIRTAQAAYRALATLATPDADRLLEAAAEDLIDGQLHPHLAADVLTAVRIRADTVADLKIAVTQWEATLSARDRLAKWRPALTGGDVTAGRRIFHDRADVQCLRCHSIAGNGGTVGPKLEGIGKQRTREELLESIVFPTAKFSPGYEPLAGSPSAMPEGYADILSLNELRDLIEYMSQL